MTVQDIKEVPDAGLFGLQTIYDLQEELIKPYIGIEGLPDYPLDVDTKENQTLLKDFIGRIIEEMGEAYQEFELLYALAQAKDKDEDKMLAHLNAFNEEVSDAIHFFLELLIYINIEAVSVWGYNEKLMNELNLNLEADGIANLLKVAEHHNRLEGRKHIANQTGYHIGTPFSLSAEGVDEFTRAGRKVGPEQMADTKAMLWDITYNLQMVRNELKNKPWTQTGHPTNTEILQETAMQSFLHFMCWLSYMGHTPKSIFTIYYKKNQVNQQRIKDKR